MIITVYGKDGKKTRKAIGYAGGACNLATAPYEAREIQGQTKKTITDEGCLPEPEQVTLDQTKIGE